LITGGAGFIGSNLALKLIQSGIKVTVLDNFSKQIHGEDYQKSELFLKIKDKVEIIRGSVENKADLRIAIENQDAIIHLAAETGTGQSMYEINRYSDVNIQGTARIFDILANEKHNIKKIVVASSRAIYGEGKYICKEHGFVYPLARKDEDMKTGDFDVKCPFCAKTVSEVATTEDSAIHPTSFYGLTKQVQEQMVLLMGKSIGIPSVALRYQNVYGPGQSLSNPYTGILSIFSTRIKNRNDIQIFEDGKESRDFVYIDDVVDATVSALLNEKANNEIFNVGTGKETDVFTVAKILNEKYKSDVKISITGNYRLGDIRTNFADTSKIKKLLNFEPKIDFETGISFFTDWVNSQDVKEDTYEKSISEMKNKGLFK
jgi:dTDP-L-rhamnose 4-epimerase